MKYIINKKTIKKINQALLDPPIYSVVDKRQYDFTRFRKEQEFTYHGLLKKINFSDKNYRVFHHKKYLLTGKLISENFENNLNLDHTYKYFIINKRNYYLNSFLVREFLAYLGFYFKLASCFRVLNFDIQIPDSQMVLRKLLIDEEKLKKNLYLLKNRKEVILNSIKLSKRNKSDKVWLLAKNVLKKKAPILNKVIYRNTLKRIVNQISINEKKLFNLKQKILEFYNKYNPENNKQLDIIHEIKPESRIINYIVRLSKVNKKYSTSGLLYDKYFVQKPVSVEKLLGCFNKKKTYNFAYLNVLSDKEITIDSLIFFRNLLIRNKNYLFYNNKISSINRIKTIQEDLVEKKNKIIPLKIDYLLYSIKSRSLFHKKKRVNIKKSKKNYKLDFKKNFIENPSFENVRFFFYKNYSFPYKYFKKFGVYVTKDKFSFKSSIVEAENTLKTFDLILLNYLKNIKNKK